MQAFEEFVGGFDSRAQFAQDGQAGLTISFQLLVKTAVDIFQGLLHAPETACFREDQRGQGSGLKIDNRLFQIRYPLFERSLRQMVLAGDLRMADSGAQQIAQFVVGDRKRFISTHSLCY